MDQSCSIRGVVLDDTLVYQHDGHLVTSTVGTPSWALWVQTATSFTFKNDEGNFTAHKARASHGRGGWYWYAYRRWRGRLFKLYLGTSERLTAHRLREAARALTARISDTERQQSASSPSSLEEACMSALQAGDFPRAASLLVGLLPHLVEQRRLEQVRRCLDQLPPVLVAATPELCVASLWMQLLQTPSWEDLEGLITQMEQHVKAQPKVAAASWAQVQSELLLLRALEAFSHHDFACAVTLLHQALSLLSGQQTGLCHIIAVQLRMFLVMTHYISGDLVAAEQLLHDIAVVGETEMYQPLNLVAAGLLAELYEAQGRLRQIGLLYDALFQVLGSRTDLAPAPLAVLQMSKAALLYEWNRLPEAARVMRQVRSIAGQLDLPIFSLLSRLLQIRIEQAQGHDTAANRFLARQEWKRGPEAAHTMQQTLPITERLNLAAFSILSLWGQMGMELAHHPAEKAGDFHDPSGRYIHEQPMIQAGAVVREERHLAAHAARLALACGRVQEALHWKETCGLHANDQLGIPLESRRYFDYMTLARLLIAQGRTEHIRSPLVQALTLLEHLRDVVVRMGLHGWLIEIQMLTALALQAQGKTRRALLTLGEVLAQAEPEGYVSLFADEGLPIAYLLAQVSVSTTASSGYLELLQAATASRQLTLSDAQQSDSCQLLSPPLSAREQEVLQLIAEGASNQQIADRLVISLNTAKRHVKHLLVKLSVTNRTQAVVRARALHLL